MLSSPEFEQLVADNLDAIPEHLRGHVKNVAVLVDDEPSDEVRKKEGLHDDETLLGYYQGIPLSQRGAIYGMGTTMPDTVTLFRIPILDAAGDDPESIRKVIRETIWHEFAHHFGMDEQQVRTREKRRRNDSGIV